MEFTLHRNASGLLPLAADWNLLLAESVTHIPFLRYEYISAWWETRGGGEWPESDLAVVTARQDGRLAGIAPLFLSRSRDGLPALFLLGSVEISDYLDILARPADLSDFIGGLLDFIAQPGLLDWRLLDWHNLPEASPTLPVLKAEVEKRGWTYAQEQTYHVPSIPLTGDFETYLAGIDKKQRHEIRRKMRRAEDCGRNVRWYIVEDGASLETEVEAFLDLMADDPEKAAFLTLAMRTQMRLACRAAFENGWLQLAFLEVDGQKAAGYLNFDYLNRIWVYNSGLDRRFMDLSAGWVLLGYLLKWANEHNRSEFDFMRGNEDYKYRFGGVDGFVVRAKVTR
jgi:CelD/BcsL family acetyltransferase involved in cellulose biosynthesis